VNEIVPVHNIGDYVPMIDGPEKVSGRAKYTADLIAPGMLAGRIFRSPYSHAEILDVDVSVAAKLPGVKAIVTGAPYVHQRLVMPGRNMTEADKDFAVCCAVPIDAPTCWLMFWWKPGFRESTASAVIRSTESRIRCGLETRFSGCMCAMRRRPPSQPVRKRI